MKVFVTGVNGQLRHDDSSRLCPFFLREKDKARPILRELLFHEAL